jgi:hypothetical protein
MMPPVPTLKNGQNPPLDELQQLRNTLERLEGIGGTNSTTIDSLKRIVMLRIAKLEVGLETGQRVSE